MKNIRVSISLQIDGVAYSPSTDGVLISEERRCKVGQVRAIGGHLYHCSKVLEDWGQWLPWGPKLVYWTPVEPGAWRAVHQAIHTECARFP